MRNDVERWQARPLGSLAAIVAGFTDRRKPAPASDLLRILQARDVSPSGEVAWNALDRCDRRAAAERALLRDGDILLTLRSADPRALRITRPPADVVAGAPFAILRPSSATLDADYLYWYLDSAAARERLRSLLRGSSMPFLSVADVGDFPIPVPPPSRQRAIARVHALRTRLLDLSRRLDHSLGLLLAQAATSSHD